MAGRLQCVACVIPWKMVFRNTGVGTQLRPVSPDTSLFERRLPGRPRTVEELPTARGTRRAVGAYLHTQLMAWVAARAFSGAWPSRRVPVRAVRCRARSVTKATELLGGWRLLAILSMHACSCECAFERLPVRTVRHTVASHDMQHIDLCEADSMLADNVALELLLPQHGQLANTERICGKWVHMGERAASDKKGYNSDNNNENNNNKWCDACGSVETCLGMRAHCNAAEWHGSHGYSGVSVAHDMCMRMRSCACLCGIVCTCLCCHGLRCGSSSRRPGHGRPDSPPFSVSPCRGLRRISWKVSLRHSKIARMD